MMSYKIYTMFVNRRELLEGAIASVARHMRSVVIIDNSKHRDLRLSDSDWRVIRPPVPLFCSQSYNLILEDAVEKALDVFFIMHSDAIASPNIIDEMLDRAQVLNEQARNWGVMFSNYDVLALHNAALLKDFRWDPYLPLYYTDCDFYFRLKLAGIEIIETHLPVEHCEGGSTTLKADLALETFVNTNYAGWRNYYIQKWGGERDHETYTTPFNLG